MVFPCQLSFSNYAKSFLPYIHTAGAVPSNGYFEAARPVAIHPQKAELIIAQQLSEALLYAPAQSSFQMKP